jgi:hypothetical protein
MSITSVWIPQPLQGKRDASKLVSHELGCACLLVGNAIMAGASSIGTWGSLGLFARGMVITHAATALFMLVFKVNLDTQKRAGLRLHAYDRKALWTTTLPPVVLEAIIDVVMLSDPLCSPRPRRAPPLLLPSLLPPLLPPRSEIVPHAQLDTPTVLVFGLQLDTAPVARNLGACWCHRAYWCHRVQQSLVSAAAVGFSMSLTQFLKW